MLYDGNSLTIQSEQHWTTSMFLKLALSPLPPVPSTKKTTLVATSLVGPVYLPKCLNWRIPNKHYLPRPSLLRSCVINHLTLCGTFSAWINHNNGFCGSVCRTWPRTCDLWPHAPSVRSDGHCAGDIHNRSMKNGFQLIRDALVLFWP
jgi:hypothetical protein